MRQRVHHTTYPLLIIAVIALLIGGILGWGIKSTTPTSTNLPIVGIGGGPGTTNDLLSLNNLLVQHGVFTTLYLQEVYDGKDTSTSSQQLSDNSQQIANIIGSTYGDKAKSNFLPLWEKHVTEYANYTKALKNNDANAMNTAKSNLASMSNDLGTFFNNLNPHISSTQVTNMMNDHIMLTLSIIDAYAHHDQATMDKQIKSAADQATQFAAYLSQGNNPTQGVSY